MRIVKIRPFGPIKLAFQVGISQWRKRRGIKKHTQAKLARNIQNTAPNLKSRIQNPPSSQIAYLNLRKSYLSYKDFIYHGAKKRDLHIQELLVCFQQTTYGRGSIPTSKYLHAYDIDIVYQNGGVSPVQGPTNAYYFNTINFV